ncbi:DUF1636 domain-containing protein [Tabrizicola sp. J26]|uniref:DUF1636 family protein n=1 Tax=Alitabrizicola rongguiensis TaxID=2909234 RepID=UPI001F427CA8|nr:DUF1636 family protein [Tabrizicola rongguiensis]MCF1710209.1 DUF1636 domain-containing protein [Tabrizicola rongguiensis]
MKVTLCATCEGYSTGYLHALRQAIEAAGLPVKVATAACMQGCARPVALAVREEGKTAYLFGETSEADLPDLMTFLSLYAASSNGELADARPLGGLRFKSIARIPG